MNDAHAEALFCDSERCAQALHEALGANAGQAIHESHRDVKRCPRFDGGAAAVGNRVAADSFAAGVRSGTAPCAKSKGELFHLI